jgi:hypothetical protein
MQKSAALILFVIAAISIGVLFLGARYSESVLIGGLPLGNILASIGLFSLAGSAFYLSPLGSARRRISQVVLILAMVWLPISILLAGNLALNFSGSRGSAWLIISWVTVVAVLGSLILSIVGAMRD